MKKALKDKLKELVRLLEEAHDKLTEFAEKKDYTTVMTILTECQNTAIAAGQAVEESEGEGTETVELLEEYCELIFGLYENAGRNEFDNPNKIKKILNKYYLNISEKLENEIAESKEVVFLPYKASMWDSLESVWKKADMNPLIDAKVIPIPYYDRNPDMSFGQLHYEGSEFPEYVPIISFNEYDFEKNHPDEIYIHNPYDDRNLVTSVHPFFYSDKLKKFTDKLIYIPYFVLPEFDIKNEKEVESHRHFVEVPAVFNADEVIVQSENIRRFYIECALDVAGAGSRKEYENKIKGFGSPKIDKIRSASKKDYKIPEEWEKYIYKEDGQIKKIILYNTSLSAMLQNEDTYLGKMKRVFDTFDKYSDEVALLWRPHPLMEATIKSMRPGMWQEYSDILNKYKSDETGIFDDSAELERAIVLSDAYYGDQSSLVELCKAAGKPIMFQNTML